MTNQIQISQNNYTSYVYDSISGLLKNGSTSSDLDFSSILTKVILNSSQSSDNPVSSGIANYGENDISSMIMLLFVKLFNQQLPSNDSISKESSPTGNPVNAQLTQGSHEGHVALDYGVPIGTKVHSTMSGKVIYAGWNNEGYGNLVIVENGDFKTYYAHLSEIPVSVGQIVNDGDVIGLSGNTGNSTGPHLHYEIRKNNIAINPLNTI